MKKIILLVLCLSVFSSYAQDDSKNLVKVNLFSLLGRTASFEYERVIKDKFSVNATFAVMPKGNLPFKSIIESFTGESSILNATQLSAISSVLEVRYYISRKKSMFRGLYVAPFVKYSNYKPSTKIVYNIRTKVSGEIPFEGDLNVFNAGVSLGAQWLFGDRWSLDWRVVGFSYGSVSGRLSGKKEITNSEQIEILDQINDFSSDFGGFKFKTEINNHGVSSKINGPWYGVRTGLAIGYRF